MAIKKVEIQDSSGIIYYPHTDASIVKCGSSTVETQLNDLTYETAGGTGTAIILSMQPLKQGYYKKFIASVDNGGAATTVNGKPLYKVCTTNSPKLKKDRPYEIYYNLTGDCFFLKASATGTTSADKVLAGETFSTENDTDLVGNMPDKSGTNKALALNESWAIPKGYHDGNGKVTQNIPNNGAINANLNCGQSKSLPAGYTSGGTITANSLASQTPSNADASKILSGYYAWINGTKVWGNASIQSLGGRGFASGSTDINVDGGSSTIALPFKPAFIFAMANMAANSSQKFHCIYADGSLGFGYLSNPYIVTLLYGSGQSSVLTVSSNGNNIVTSTIRKGDVANPLKWIAVSV